MAGWRDQDRGRKYSYQDYWRGPQQSLAALAWVLELETKVHPKVRNHGEGPY